MNFGVMPSVAQPVQLALQRRRRRCPRRRPGWRRRWRPTLRNAWTTPIQVGISLTIGVAPVDEGVEDQLERLRAAGGDQDVLAAGADPLIARSLASRASIRPGVARVVAVLQSALAALGEDAGGDRGDLVAGSEAGSGKPKMKEMRWPTSVHALQERRRADLLRARRESRASRSAAAVAGSHGHAISILTDPVDSPYAGILAIAGARPGADAAGAARIGLRAQAIAEAGRQGRC